MLPLKNRLKKEKDFELVFKNGIGRKEEFLFLKFAANKLEDSRFGFVVSKKVSNKSVVRNKIKRRLRDLVKRSLPRIKKGIDAVIVVSSGAQRASFEELGALVEKILIKSRVIN
jgi:ribonuclease P protein component